MCPSRNSTHEEMFTVLQVPNGFGCALGAMQLILYAIYRKNKGGADKLSGRDDSMETGLGKPHQEKQSNTHNGGH